MTGVIDTIERAQLRRVPDFSPGDRVRVHFQVIEGNRRRTQVFEGVAIKRQGHGARETFTVRKQSFGVGVERTFPLHSPKIERIQIAARGDVRRAKLYYLRERVGKRARVRERGYVGPEQAIEPGLLFEPSDATDAEGVTADEAVAAEAGVADSGDAAGAEVEGGAAEGSDAGGEAAAGGQAAEVDAAGEAGSEPEAADAASGDGKDQGHDATGGDGDGERATEPAAKSADASESA